MSKNIYVHRPWVSYFQELAFSNDKLDQQCKLIRNQIASMDLGNPHFKLFDSHFRAHRSYRIPRREQPTGRELYLEWVADWKQTYRELSETIRRLKRQRSFAGFSEVEAELRKRNKGWDNYSPGDAFRNNTARVREAHEALVRAAQVMLNARWVAKLASAELRRRAYEQRVPVAE